MRIVAKILDHYMTVRRAANFLLLLSLHLRTWSSCHSWYFSVRIYTVCGSANSQQNLNSIFTSAWIFRISFFVNVKLSLPFAFHWQVFGFFFVSFAVFTFGFTRWRCGICVQLAVIFYSFCFFHLFTLVPSSLFKFNAFLHLSCSRFSSPFAALGSPSALLWLSSPSHVAICCYLGVVEFAVKNSRQLSGAWVWWGSNCARCHR